MNYIKRIISFSISVLLMFSLIISAFYVFFVTTIVNVDYYTKVYEDNEIIDKVYESINKNVQYEFVKNNIPKKYIKGFVQKNEIKEEIHSSYSALFEYLKGEKSDIEKVDTSKYIKRVDKAFDEYIKDYQLIENEVSNEVFKSIKEKVNKNIISEITVINMDNTNIIIKFDKIKKGITLFSSKKMCLGLVIIDLVLIIALVLTRKENKIKGIQWIGNAFLAAGIIKVAVGLSGYISGFYNYLAIDPKYIRDAFSNIVKGYFVNIIIIGSIMVCIGIILLAIYLLKYKNNRGTINN